MTTNETSDSEFGVKVAINPVANSARSLGRFLSADEHGELFSVAVNESVHSTSIDSTTATEYTFQKRSIGSVKQPQVWSAIAAFSGVFLIALLLLGFIGGDSIPDIGLPLWVLQLILGGIFAVSSAAQLNTIVKFLGLRHNLKVLDELEKSYGKNYVLDLPVGKAREVAVKMQDALDDLVGLRVKNMGTAGTVDFALDSRIFNDDTIAITESIKEEGRKDVSQDKAKG